jgi:formylmethanofuran dehydrogenase subunit B
VKEHHSGDEAQTIEDVTCTVCGCVCDDLRVTVSNRRIQKVEPPCPLATPWFDALAAAEGKPVPPARIDGSPVPLDAAIEEAAKILSASRAPLVWGLSDYETDAQRQAVELAEELGATIDTTASVCHAASIMAIQAVGESTSSLGEIRGRADLVIYWSANPVKTHPRHMERYSMEPKSEWLPQGRKDRTLIVVDNTLHETAALADRLIRIKPGKDFEAIWTLRQLIRGESPMENVETGAALEDLKELARRMVSCRYGAVFFGLGLARTHLGYLNVEALLKLVAELNDHTRFTARRLRIPGNVSGADSVLCWQTGYPFGVNLGRGVPRYNPGEFTAGELLERGEVDACLLVGTQDVSELSPRAQEHLAAIPIVALDFEHMAPKVQARVQFPTAACGVHHAGTVYRMDEIPLPVKPLLDSQSPRASDVLRAILHSVRQ